MYRTDSEQMKTPVKVSSISALLSLDKYILIVLSDQLGNLFL